MKRQLLYLDNCTLGPPFDLQSHGRIKMESAALFGIMALIKKNEVIWIASDVLIAEIEDDEDEDVREQKRELCLNFARIALVNGTDRIRSKQLQGIGFGPYDALHLALAERMDCSALLTTDDRFLKRCKRCQREILVTVENPVDWMLQYWTQ